MKLKSPTTKVSISESTESIADSRLELKSNAPPDLK